MLTHVGSHIFRTARQYELQTWNRAYACRTTTHISHRRHDLQGQRSRSQGHVISLSRLGSMLYLCLRGRQGAYRIGRTGRPQFLHLSCCTLQLQLHAFVFFCRAMFASSGVFAVMWCPSVCVCVCLSGSYILSKRVNISSDFFHRPVDHDSSFPHQTGRQ